MSGLDLLRFAATALARHRLRSALSLLGVAIGVAAVVLLTALGEGARRYVTGQFEELGTNLLIVIPGRTETTGALPGIGKPPNDLTLDDALALRRRVPQLARTVPVVVGPETISRRERRRQILVIGATHEFLQVRKLRLGAGRFLPDVPADRSQPVAVIGDTIARELFPGESPLGQVVRLGGWRLRVIGVLAARGTHMGMDVDQLVVIPVATGMRLFDRSSLFRILCDVRAHSDMEHARRRVVEVIRDRHDGEEDVTLITQDSVLSSFSAVLTALTAALAGIAAISLSVAGLGIMNVMLVSVSERTPEVGLLRALGATRRQVLAVFLAEAVLLAGSGGVAGVTGASVVVGALRWAYPAFPVAPPWWAVAAALIVSLAAGAIFGVLPARRATRLDPVLALGKQR